MTRESIYTRHPEEYKVRRRDPDLLRAVQLNDLKLDPIACLRPPPDDGGIAMVRESNYQDILKLIAIIAVVIDHLGLYIFPDILEMRILGRYAFPIFCFFAGFNFKGRINFKILIYGIALYLVTSYVLRQFLEANILVSIFLGQLYLYLFRTHFFNFQKAYIHFTVIACCWPFTREIIDYGTLAIAVMILGQIVKQHPRTLRLMAFSTAFISLLHTAFVYYGYFSIIEFVCSFIIAFSIYISLTLNNFYKTNNLKLVIISNNLMLIYCLQMVVIVLIWRYYIIV